MQSTATAWTHRQAEPGIPCRCVRQARARAAAPGVGEPAGRSPADAVVCIQTWRTADSANGGPAERSTEETRLAVVWGNDDCGTALETEGLWVSGAQAQRAAGDRIRSRWAPRRPGGGGWDPPPPAPDPGGPGRIATATLAPNPPVDVSACLTRYADPPGSPPDPITISHAISGFNRPETLSLMCQTFEEIWDRLDSGLAILPMGFPYDLDSAGAPQLIEGWPSAADFLPSDVNDAGTPLLREAMENGQWRSVQGRWKILLRGVSFASQIHGFRELDAWGLAQALRLLHRTIHRLRDWSPAWGLSGFGIVEVDGAGIPTDMVEHIANVLTDPSGLPIHIVNGTVQGGAGLARGPGVVILERAVLTGSNQTLWSDHKDQIVADWLNRAAGGPGSMPRWWVRNIAWRLGRIASLVLHEAAHLIWNARRLLLRKRRVARCRSQAAEKPSPKVR